jgi:hypothetical protein
MMHPKRFHHLLELLVVKPKIVESKRLGPPIISAIL